MSTAETLEALVAAGRFAEARRIALAAADDAEPAPLQQLLGRLAWLEGDRGGARAHLEAAAELGPLPDDLAVLQAHLAAPAQAEETARTLGGAAGASPRARLAWGEHLGTTGRWAEAADIFAEVLKTGTDPQHRASAALGLVACADALDDPPLGQRGIAALTATWPALSEDRAIPALSTLVRLDPELARSLADRLALGGLPRAAHRLLSARIAWFGGRHDEALAAARAALELDPDDDGARRFLAELLLLDDRVEQARPLVQDLVERDASPPDLPLALIMAARRAGHDRSTIDAILDLARRHPHHPGIQVEAARALTDVGREHEARAMLAGAMAADGRLRTRLGPLEQFFAVTREGIDRIFDKAGVGPQPRPVRVRMGHNSLLYQVHTADGDHFAKIFLPGARSRTHIEATAALESRLGALPDAPLAVPRAIAVDGALTQPVGDGFAVVMPAIEGRSLRRSLEDVRRQLTPMHGAEVGRALAELHTMLDRVAHDDTTWARAPAESGVRGGFSTAADWAAGRKDWRILLDGLAENLVEARLTEALGARMAPLFNRWRRVLPALEEGVIHGDFGWHNLLWQDGRVVGVVDFDYAANDIRAADLANAIHRTAFDFNRLQRGLSPRPRPDVAAAIVRAYRAVRPLPVPDYTALDAVARGVRCVYTLSLARADRASLTGRQYGRPALLVEALIRQLDWLERHGGLGAMLRGEGL